MSRGRALGHVLSGALSPRQALGWGSSAHSPCGPAGAPTHLEGQSQDAPRRRYIPRQPLGLGAHKPQHLRFGAMGHSPLQQRLQGLPGRQGATVTARARGALTASAGVLRREFLLQSSARSMIHRVLRRREGGEIFSLHKGSQSNYSRGCYKARHCYRAKPDGGTSRGPFYGRVS